MSEVSNEQPLPLPLPWQESMLRHLMGQYRQGRLHHAWLLHGPEGIGKLDFAMALAAARLCRNASDTGAACGECKACRLMRAGSHPDLLQVVPEENRSALKIDRIRQVGEFVSQTATYSGSARVVVLAPAEALGQGAANALLKNLEEPPGDSLFLLISHVPGAVLPTIRSRCQPLSLPEPDADTTLRWLHARGGDPADAGMAARLAPSQPLKALRLMEENVPALFVFLERGSGEFLTGTASLAELVRGCHDSDARQVVAWLLSDLHRRTVNAASAGAVPGGQRTAPLFPAYRDLLTFDRQLAGSANPNRQLTLESAFLRWKQGVSQCR
ncbi:MAG: DNA polymerase III subunit delta' [Pseudohongiellaceae bacterium]